MLYHQHRVCPVLCLHIASCEKVPSIKLHHGAKTQKAYILNCLSYIKKYDRSTKYPLRRCFVLLGRHTPTTTESSESCDVQVSADSREGWHVCLRLYLLFICRLSFRLRCFVYWVLMRTVKNMKQLVGNKLLSASKINLRKILQASVHSMYKELPGFYRETGMACVFSLFRALDTH